MKSEAVVLVVDDTPSNIDVLSAILSPHYRVKVATSGQAALAIASANPKPDLILLDVMMPGMDGLETCRRLKDNPVTSTIPVMFVTALNDESDEERGLALGAVDYVTKPIRSAIVLARIRTHLMAHDQNLVLEHKVRLRTEELTRTRLEIIQRLGRAAEFRDNETGLHILRMSHFSRLIAQAYCGRDDWADAVFHTAPMHDVGKIGIPDHILLKAGALTAEEWVVMRQHPQLGADIIGDCEFELMAMSRNIALAHHEKWDGSGYPHGLSHENIPLAARIVAVADVFDALTTERPYKSAWTTEAAVQHMSEQRGRHFDPQALDCFLARFDEILAVRDRFMERPKPYLQAV